MQFYIQKQIKVKEDHFYCCSAFHSHSRVFNNVHNSYLNISSVNDTLLLLLINTSCISVLKVHVLSLPVQR